MAINILAEYKQGNFITFKTIESLRGKMLVNEEEVNKYELRVENDNFKWNELGTSEYLDFEFSEGERKLMFDMLDKLDKDDKLQLTHITLYEKFSTVC